MRKASKWIKNFLMGKREEKENEERAVPSVTYAGTSTAMVQSAPRVRRRWSFGRSKSKEIFQHKFCKENEERAVPSVTYAGTSTAMVQSAPRVRRRWSFGRSKSKEIFQHKFCKSLDATDASILPVQVMIEYARTRNISPWVVSAERGYDFRDKAATKIQAVFRAFLARTALCALRGLVKIQALVRGHLVRKKTTATLRCMHALMTIQVRARVQRIQMAEEGRAIVTRQSLMQCRFPQDGFSSSQIKSTFYPSRLKYDHRGEEESLATHSSLRHCPSKTVSSPEETVGHSVFYRPEYLNRTGDEQQPSYMGNTKSSKAKERAQSEPKQRPISGTREKARNSISIEGAGVYGLGKNFHSTAATPSVSTTKSIGHSRFIRDYEPHLRMY